MYKNDCRLLIWNRNCDIPISFGRQCAEWRSIVKLWSSCSKKYTF